MKIDWQKASSDEKKGALTNFTEQDIKNIKLLCDTFGGRVEIVTDEDLEDLNKGLSADEYLRWCEKSRQNKLDEQYIKDRPYKKWSKNTKTK